METVKALEDMGAEVIGAACIADRRAADCDSLRCRSTRR